MKLKGKILLVALPLIIILGVVITAYATNTASVAMKDEIKEELIATVLCETDNVRNTDGNNYFIGDDDCLYNGEDWNLTEDTEAIDKIKAETGIVTTVFFGDTRYLTSVVKDDGKRALYTQASGPVVDEVIKKGNSYFAENVDVVGKPYFAYYSPIYNEGESEPCGMVFAGKPQSKVDDMVASLLKSTIIIAVILVVIAAVVLVIFAQYISKKLAKTVGALDEVSRGNLQVRIDSEDMKGHDETAAIAKSVSNLKDSLSGVVGEIITKSKEVNSCSIELTHANDRIVEAVEQIERAINEIAEGATSQAADTAKATDGVVNMGNIVELTDKNVEVLYSASNDMEKSGNVAYETLKELETVNNEAKDSIDIIYEQTNTTNESAMKIAEAITFITSIAEETNLLSLNASIEAARAGEQGRGFAVVASQIQKLAEQSNESAKKIDEITKLLMEDSQKAVETMENVKSIMQKQSEMVEKTAGSFNDVMDGIEKSRTSIQDISHNMSELNEARSAVIDIVSNLSAIAEENAASTEETSASATEVNSVIQDVAEGAQKILGLSQELETSVNSFKL